MPHRTRTVRVRMTEEEYANLSERAENFDLTRSELIRQSLQKVHIHPVIKVSVTDDKLIKSIGDMITEYARIGGNLNQIARHLNQFGEPYSDLTVEVRSAIGELNALKYDVTKLIGDAIGNDKTYKL